MAKLILPHTLEPPQRHARIPNLWRVRCLCGWVAIARGETKACCDAAILEHRESFDPFNPIFTGEETVH